MSKRKRNDDDEQASEEKEKVRFTTHSKSLYNITQSPGWTEEENKVLRLAIMKFGVGAWTKMLSLGILPGKTNAQYNLQVQRMLGQQSLAGYAMLKVDASQVRRDNEAKIKDLAKNSDDKVYIKSGLLINAGENPTKESKLKLLEENRKKYELSEEDINSRVNDFDLFLVKRAKRIEFEDLLRKYSIFDRTGDEDDSTNLDETKKLGKQIEQEERQLKKMMEVFEKSNSKQSLL
ncbi:telomere repeat-binding factor [Acrasis kona]|uniref:Telomere repeat-binding factor n=1 Tax=Acrasis kona TaxID=1008807 RepID=A0AAW2YTC6_9EUKA